MVQTLEQSPRCAAGSQASAGTVLTEGEDGLLDDVDALAQLLLAHDERRCEADLVSVRRLGEQTVVAQTQAHVPRTEL